MKVDKKKLAKLMADDRPKKNYGPVVKGTACVTLCLALLGTGTVYRSLTMADRVSADALYGTVTANPSFRVQHMADMGTVDLQPGDGAVTVLTDWDGSHCVQLDDDGTVRMVTVRRVLYDEYTTDWLTTDSIAAASFLNSVNGADTEGYVLKEVWFGKDGTSENQSDFLVLPVPSMDGHADLSRVVLTNNPLHPGLSKAEGGRYLPDGDGNYTICVQDGDVVRLVFGTEELLEYAGADVYDYDVSDGGYYESGDFFHMGTKQPTSRQQDEKGIIYVNAIEEGIHEDANYSGTGPKLAFGGDGIGTDLAGESFSDELDTLNVYNYKRQEETHGTGVTKGLAAGVREDGSLKWSDGIRHLDLFGRGAMDGRTDYVDGEYSLVFRQDGFSRTLASVSHDGTETVTGLDRTMGSGFWILDGSPSSGTDGHDPLWGSSEGSIQYYRSGDRAPASFAASEDGQDHDRFFGLAFTEGFTLSPGYTGALEFLGYSDDDLWVFAGQVDGDGRVMADTVIQVADLGGVHDGAAYHCDLWDKIDRIPYGGDAQDWRLFVYWLERDGVSADCYLNFTLPEPAITDVKETCSVTVEAIDYRSANDMARTFLFDDGTHDMYHATYSDGTEAVITSGQEFPIPGGLSVNIDGLTEGTPFTVEETGRLGVWHSGNDGFEEGSVFAGTVGDDMNMAFLSTDGTGMLTVTAQADGGPEGGYAMRLTLQGAGTVEVSAMDGDNRPLGSRFTDGDGVLDLNIMAGGTLKLYGLPEDVSFLLEPQPVPGWHLSRILSDSAGTSGSHASGTLPARVTCRYEANETIDPGITMEQSVGGDWTRSGIVLGTGTLLSYRIKVTNPNDTPLGVTVTDTLPEGLTVVGSSLTDGCVEDGQELEWDLTLEPGSVKELSFTCQVDAEGTCTMENDAWVLLDNELVENAGALTVTIP